MHVEDLTDQNSKIYNHLNDPNLRENEDKDILEKEEIRKKLFTAFGQRVPKFYNDQWSQDRGKRYKEFYNEIPNSRLNEISDQLQQQIGKHKLRVGDHKYPELNAEYFKKYQAFLMG